MLLKMNLPGFFTIIAWKWSQAQPQDISHDTDSLDLKLHTQEHTHTGTHTSTNAHTSSHAPSISLILCLSLFVFVVWSIVCELSATALDMCACLSPWCLP